MAEKNITLGGRRPLLTRILAAMALVAVYGISVLGTSAVVLATTTSSALAWRGGGRGWGGRGWGGGYGRGWGRGRGYGFYGGPVVVAPGYGCYWSYRWGRRICPY
jgi:hypothetical protein